MNSIKKIAVFSLLFLFIAGQVKAYSWDYTPDDPNIVYQTYFDLINIKPSWSNDIQVKKEVVVAVLDSGVDMNHPDLYLNIWKNEDEIPNDGIDNDKNSYIDDSVGWDFIDSDSDPEPEVTEGYNFTAINHGTVVAGIIAASINSKGIVGIAPQAKIMPLRILDNHGVGNTLVLSQAIDYAVENGADIINLSLVGTNYGDALKKSIINAYNHGVMIIAASGNEESVGENLNITPHYPVCDIDNVNRVFGVAAVDQNQRLAEFSNYGSDCIDISAPGVRFYSTLFNERSFDEFTQYYGGGWSGTSVAAPVVSGAAALIKMNYPDFSPHDIYTIMKESSSSLMPHDRENYKDLGAGLIDIGAALNLADKYYNEIIDIVIAPELGQAPKISIMDNEGNLKNVFLAYAEGFTGGVNVAVGDVNGDGQKEIITAPGPGGGPHIRIFNRSGELVSQFFAYNNNFYGGVNVAVGDVNGDGQKEIITAPLATGGPHVRVYDFNGKLIDEFFAYDKDFTVGINIALGDVNNDGVDEIITAPASNSLSEIRVFDSHGLIKSVFRAYGDDVYGGFNISVGDVNNDLWPEIITVPASGNSPHVKMFSIKGRLKGEFMSFSTTLKSGVKVQARDISGDFMPEILVLPSRGSSALLRIYDSNGLEKDSLYLRDSLDRNGYNFDIL